MKEKGVTLIELIITIIIISVTGMIFSGLISDMIQSSMFLMGGKGSYQEVKEALKQVADEIRYNVRGGANHNLGVVDAGPQPLYPVWEQTSTYPCTSSRFTFMPDFPPLVGPGNTNPNRRVRFMWDSLAVPGLPAGWYLRREEATDETSRGNSAANPPTLTILAGGVTGTDVTSPNGSLTIKYYDQAGNSIPVAASGLTYAQATTVSRIELILAGSQWGRTMTLSETVYVTQKGPFWKGQGWV